MTRRSRAETVPTGTGLAALMPDPDNATGWTLYLDGIPQSYVDTGDPTRLEFEYVRRLAAVVDLKAPPGEPLPVLHLGGGALTLPRYVAVTRPRSPQRVVEIDADLTTLVRQRLPLPRGADVRVRAADARAAVAATGDARFDLVVSDVYRGARTPASLGTVEAATEVARVLRDGGWYAVNISDGPPLAYVKAQLATLRAVFPEVCLMAEPAVLKGRRFGNLVAVAGPGLPVDGFARDASRDPFPARVLHGRSLTDFVAGAKPVPDSAAVPSPRPPEKLFA